MSEVSVSQCLLGLLFTYIWPWANRVCHVSTALHGDVLEGIVKTSWVRIPELAIFIKYLSSKSSEYLTGLSDIMLSWHTWEEFEYCGHTCAITDHHHYYTGGRTTGVPMLPVFGLTKHEGRGFTRPRSSCEAYHFCRTVVFGVHLHPHHPCSLVNSFLILRFTFPTNEREITIMLSMVKYRHV